MIICGAQRQQKNSVLLALCLVVIIKCSSFVAEQLLSSPSPSGWAWRRSWAPSSRARWSVWSTATPPAIPASGRSWTRSGYGFLIPVFFVSSGIRLDLRGLLEDPAALVRVPVFLVALLLVRGVPAVLYRRSLGRAGAVAAGLLQATSLPFLVTAAQIGTVTGRLSDVDAAALVCAGLLSVLVFPATALGLLTSSAPGTAAARPDAAVPARS
jgi:hypothetical protein